MSENDKVPDIAADLVDRVERIKAELAEGARDISWGAKRASAAFAQLARFGDRVEAMLAEIEDLFVDLASGPDRSVDVVICRDLDSAGRPRCQCVVEPAPGPGGSDKG